MSRASRSTAALLWLMACVSIVYIGDIGRGFVKDDFGWVLHNGLHSLHDLRVMATTPAGGFYRPLVSLSFAIDRLLFGVHPMAYALTNLAIVLAGVAGIAWLARRLGLDPFFAVLAAALWSLNFYGVDGTLMWISGRTSSIATLLAVLAGVAFAARRALAAGVLVFCALLAKEEPVLLPAVFAIWAWLDTRPLRAVATRTWPSFLALAIYLALRSTTASMTPLTASPAYRLSLSPAIVVPNVLQYTDRSLTFMTAVVLVAILLFSRRIPRLDTRERLIALKGLVWLVVGFAVTITVPVRSSLYVCFPAVGSALAGATVLSAVARDVPEGRSRRIAGIVLALLPLLLWPVYRARNADMRNQAVLSARAMTLIGSMVDANPNLRRVVVYDDPESRASMARAFGDGLPDAVMLLKGRTVSAEIVGAAPAPRPQAEPTRRDSSVAELALRGSELVVVGD